MIKRTMEPYLLDRAQKLPVLAILGPRQSGKTTLARQTFKKHKYISLEEPKTGNSLKRIRMAFFIIRNRVENLVNQLLRYSCYRIQCLIISPKHWPLFGYSNELYFF